MKTKTRICHDYQFQYQPIVWTAPRPKWVGCKCCIAIRKNPSGSMDVQIKNAEGTRWLPIHEVMSEYEACDWIYYSTPGLTCQRTWARKVEIGYLHPTS
jgi:hypothetical protein